MTDVTGGSVKVVVLALPVSGEHEVMIEVGPVIEIVAGVHVPWPSEQEVTVDAGRVKVDGEQVPTPPTGEHELIVIVEAARVAQVWPAERVVVMVVASQLPQVEDPPETPPTSLALVLPPYPQVEAVVSRG